MRFSFSRSIFFILFIATSFWACQSDDSSNESGDETGDTTIVTDPYEQEIVTDAEASGILGRWELIEKRVPVVIKMSGTFFTFNSDGLLTISNPGDADLEDRSYPFNLEDSSLTFDSPYKLLFINGDSLVLEAETDNIRELNILKRR